MAHGSGRHVELRKIRRYMCDFPGPAETGRLQEQQSLCDPSRVITRVEAAQDSFGDDVFPHGAESAAHGAGVAHAIEARVCVPGAIVPFRENQRFSRLGKLRCVQLIGFATSAPRTLIVRPTSSARSVYLDSCSGTFARIALRRAPLREMGLGGQGR